MNEDVIEPIRNNYKLMILGIISFVFLFGYIRVLISFEGYKYAFKKICCFFVLFLIFIILSALSSVSIDIALKNMNKPYKAKDIEPKNNFN